MTGRVEAGDEVVGAILSAVEAAGLVHSHPDDGVCDLEAAPPLYDAINPEALATLVGHGRRVGTTDFRVSFEYCDARVEVHGDGIVTVVPNAGE